jgi:hypothetical protein
MSKGNTFENDLMKMIFQAAAIANMCDANAGTANIEIGLHSADPGEAGDQTTSELSYTGYARVPVSRNAAGWTVSNNQAVNANAVAFGEDTSGNNTAVFASAGIAHTGAGKILYSGQLTANLAISPGITPSFAAGQITFGEE